MIITKEMEAALIKMTSPIKLSEHTLIGQTGNSPDEKLTVAIITNAVSMAKINPKTLNDLSLIKTNEVRIYNYHSCRRWLKGSYGLKHHCINLGLDVEYVKVLVAKDLALFDKWHELNKTKGK